jgi:hypothetical protein
VHERLVRAEIFGQRAVAADDRQVEIEFARYANRKVGAATGDEHDAHAGFERFADGGRLRSEIRSCGIEQGAVEIEGDEVDAHGRGATLSLSKSRSFDVTQALQRKSQGVIWFRMGKRLPASGALLSRSFLAASAALRFRAGCSATHSRSTGRA